MGKYGEENNAFQWGELGVWDHPHTTILTLFKLLLCCMMKILEKLQMPSPINFSKL